MGQFIDAPHEDPLVAYHKNADGKWMPFKETSGRRNQWEIDRRRKAWKIRCCTVFSISFYGRAITCQPAIAFALCNTEEKPEPVIRTSSGFIYTMSKDYKKDIFSILADGVELLHKRLSLLYITFNFMAADKNYLYFLF